jgi:hypothetical protein
MVCMTDGAKPLFTRGWHTAWAPAVVAADLQKMCVLCNSVVMISNVVNLISSTGLVEEVEVVNPVVATCCLRELAESWSKSPTCMPRGLRIKVEKDSTFDIATKFFCEQNSDIHLDQHRLKFECEKVCIAVMAVTVHIWSQH